MEFEGRSRIEDQLSMAPLIDVVFLLLLFFMLTSTFVEPEAIDLSLPQSSTAAPVEKAPIEVAATADGRLFLNGEPVLLEALTASIEALMAADPDQIVTLKTDAELRVQAMIEVVDKVREGGGRSLAFVTEPVLGGADTAGDAKGSSASGVEPGSVEPNRAERATSSE